MYKNNLLRKDGIIYDTTDECSKRYIFENEMWLLSVLGFTNIVRIYICINTSGHGRNKIGVVNGYDKTYLKKICS